LRLGDEHMLSGASRGSGGELRTSFHRGAQSIFQPEERPPIGDRLPQRLGLALLIVLVLMNWGVEPSSAQGDAAGTPEAAEEYEVYGVDEIFEAEESPELDEADGAGEAAGPDPSAASPAADAGTPKLTAKEHEKLEVLVVKAKRGSQNLQKVPEAISSFSSADLLTQGITDFNTLQYSVPSLFSGDGLTKITLRGVGSEIVGPGVDPGFAVHINNVFSARETTGLVDYFDIERVDILRGPQGTLWGRNSTGGAINIITNKPSYDFDTKADIEYGAFDGNAHGVRLRGMVNTPLVGERLALRLAFLMNYNSGIFVQESEENRQRVSDSMLGSIRASLLWEPHEDVRVDLIGSWLRLNESGSGQKFDGDYETPPDNVWMGAGPGFDFTGALPNPDSPYRGTADEHQSQDSDVWTATALVRWQADQFELDSITGFQMTNFFLHRDQDTSSLRISTLDLTDKSRQISQEFLLNSSWDFPVNYTLGTIYQYDWTPRTSLFIPNFQNTDDATPLVLYPSLAPPPGLIPTISLVDGCPPNSPFLPGNYAPSCPDTKLVGEARDDFVSAYAKVKNHVFGLYGNLSWEIIESLTLNAGGRFSYTHRNWNDQTLAQNWSIALPPLYGIQILQKGRHQTHDWKAGTWKVSVDYQLMEEHLLWASVGTGSRAGGFNFSEEEPFDDESILAVEAGTKSMFFDNRLMLNLTGFWYDWDDPQIAGTENALPLTRNAPSAVSYGIELEWRALPVDDLSLNGTFGWLESFYNEDYYSRDQTQQDYTEDNILERAKLVNLNGNQMPRSPRFSVSVGAQYTFHIGEWGSLIPRVDFYYRDDITFRQYDNPDDVAPAYTRTDARIIWRSHNGSWWGEVYARNLENNAVRTNQEIVANIYRKHYYDAPRNGGFRFGYNFR